MLSTDRATSGLCSWSRPGHMGVFLFYDSVLPDDFSIASFHLLSPRLRVRVCEEGGEGDHSSLLDGRPLYPFKRRPDSINCRPSTTGTSPLSPESVSCLEDDSASSIHSSPPKFFFGQGRGFKYFSSNLNFHRKKTAATAPRGIKNAADPH